MTFAEALPGTEFSVLSPVPTTLQDLFDTFPPHTGVSLLDLATALFVTLPELDANVFTSELADNDVVDAVGGSALIIPVPPTAP